MFRLIRTAVSVTILGVALWAAFAVDLGGRTFAEHIDTISETPEAEQLIQGTRSKINPALQELRDRVLGEYVEAPTWIPDPADARAGVPASTLAPEPKRQRTRSTDSAPPLPGQRGKPKAVDAPPLPGQRGKPKSGDAPPLPGQRSKVKADETYEPALPGRR